MRIHDTTLITIAGGGRGERCYCSCGGPSLCCVSTSTPLRLPPTSSHPCHRHLCRPHRETKDPRTDACLLVSIPILSDAEWNSVSMPADTRGRPAFARTLACTHAPSTCIHSPAFYEFEIKLDRFYQNVSSTLGAVETKRKIRGNRFNRATTLAGKG